MDKGALVREQVYEGRRIVERFAADGNGVRAAFWVRDDEAETWQLFVVAEIVEKAGDRAANEALRNSYAKLGVDRMFQLKVRLFGPNEREGKDMLAVMAGHASGTPTRLGRTKLGSLVFDEVYIYPESVFTFSQSNPMTVEDLGREIFRIMNRPGTPQPSRVSLKDGTAFEGVPFSVEMGAQNAMVVRMIAPGETALRTVRLDEINSIG